ncbi:TPM domain-containing protein [Wenyingzhuangia sp. 2_MG-2023]|uniref:TPM domain-containing protein n=1 Tax=Wenyingzhuangia sp. 2_MG-2023 TaxID=3062639 RepID=UPI0026E2114E|nr:TPM domain-containing protein [Wenyingzhuangia sp. 2_MG-2023]MDO6738034.1 TPM domain-containing protein [Wenyingzhuangia sp. 2_MG-2023]MDO6802612.1 TPM domain-containing protein [Wenyingzhuangia sp. 1_MG-2023]
MSKQPFFTEQEEQQIVTAIQKAEKNTSGEIRVHIEATFEGDVMDRAIYIFNDLKMYETKAKNGVLFYLATEAKQFVILGDDGINDVVPVNFWESTKNKVINQFKKGQFAQGLIDGIQEAGQQLKIYFQYQDDDINELPDEISKN